MRDIVLILRVYDTGLHKIEALIPSTGQSGLAGAVRYILDKAYDRDVLGVRPPCKHPHRVEE